MPFTDIFFRFRQSFFCRVIADAARRFLHRLYFTHRRHRLINYFLRLLFIPP